MGLAVQAGYGLAAVGDVGGRQLDHAATVAGAAPHPFLRIFRTYSRA
jgi:hypothetical protein